MLAGKHTVRDPVMKKVEGRDSHMKLSRVLCMYPCPHSHVLLQSYTYSLNNKPNPNPSSTVVSREGSAFTEGVGHPQNPAFYSVQLHGSYMSLSHLKPMGTSAHSDTENVYHNTLCTYVWDLFCVEFMLVK